MKIFSLKKGDRVVQKLTKYLEDNSINSGCFIALGALSEAELMIYDLENKKYLTKKLDGPLEVGNFLSIIAKDPELNHHIHPHITLCNKNFETFCGHLKEATVGATLEVIYLENDQEITRYKDSDIGLNLIK